MKAIIMAGGEGTRLRPLTCRRPKPLVPVANRPVMEYCVELLRQHGFKDIGVTLQYLPDIVQEYFGDGSDFGVHFHYFVEEAPLGTAGSVKNAASFLNETFIVVSGDALTDFDLSQAVKFHRERGALATLVLTRVGNPLEYGVVIADPSGRIQAFLEKPSWGEVFSDRVNTGIYVLEPEVLRWVPEGRAFDFSKDLFPLLLREGKPLFAITLEGYWCDIGNISQYWQAHHDILSGKVKLKVLGENQGRGMIIGERVEIHPEAEILGPVLIGSFCCIEEGAKVGPFTVLGPYCHIGRGAKVERAVLWDSVRVGPRAWVEGGILLNGAVLESNSRVLEGAVIGNGSRVEARAEVRPGVKVWPQKSVGEGTVLRESLIWGQGIGRPLFIGSAAPLRLRDNLSPGQATRLGAAFGSTFKLGTPLGVSTYRGGTGEMFYRAMVAGLLSSGVKVVEMGKLLTPVFRFGIRALQLQGGCLIKEDALTLEKAWLHFMNSHGADLPPGEVRKIENLYWREETRAIREEQVVESTYQPGLEEAYENYLLKSIDTKAINRQGLRVALGCQEGSAELTSRLLARAGCEVIRLDFAPRQSWSEIKEQIGSFADEVRRYQADIGAVIDKNGERLLLLDANGFVVEETSRVALLTQVYLEETDRKSLTLPMAAPRAAELVAQKLGGRVRRVKNHPGVLQKAILEEEDRGRYSQFNLQFDALASLVYLIDWLVRRDLPLNEAVARLPAVYRSTREVPCPWEDKGRVMRALISREEEGQLELLDGLQVSYPYGWALIFPDEEEPLYRIYSEAFSQEAAEELAGFFEGRIKEILEVTEL